MEISTPRIMLASGHGHWTADNGLLFEDQSQRMDTFC